MTPARVVVPEHVKKLFRSAPTRAGPTPGRPTTQLPGQVYRASDVRRDLLGRVPTGPGSGGAAPAAAAVAGGRAGGGGQPPGHDHRSDAPPGDRGGAGFPAGPRRFLTPSRSRLIPTRLRHPLTRPAQPAAHVVAPDPPSIRARSVSEGNG